MPKLEPGYRIRRGDPRAPLGERHLEWWTDLSDGFMDEVHHAVVFAASGEAQRFARPLRVLERLEAERDGRKRRPVVVTRKT